MDECACELFLGPDGPCILAHFWHPYIRAV